jgi:hypothetical protein
MQNTLPSVNPSVNLSFTKQTAIRQQWQTQKPLCQFQPNQNKPQQEYCSTQVLVGKMKDIRCYLYEQFLFTVKSHLNICIIPDTGKKL